TSRRPAAATASRRCARAAAKRTAPSSNASRSRPAPTPELAPETPTLWASGAQVRSEKGGEGRELLEVVRAGVGGEGHGECGGADLGETLGLLLHPVGLAERIERVLVLEHYLDRVRLGRPRR